MSQKRPGVRFLGGLVAAVLLVPVLIAAPPLGTAADATSKKASVRVTSICVNPDTIRLEVRHESGVSPVSYELRKGHTVLTGAPSDSGTPPFPLEDLVIAAGETQLFDVQKVNGIRAVPSKWSWANHYSGRASIPKQKCGSVRVTPICRDDDASTYELGVHNESGFDGLPFDLRVGKRVVDGREIGATGDPAPLAGLLVAAGESRFFDVPIGEDGIMAVPSNRSWTNLSEDSASTPDTLCVPDVPLELAAGLASSDATPPPGATTISAAAIPEALIATDELFDSTVEASPIKAFLSQAPIKAFPIKAFPIKAFPIKAFPIKAFFDTAEPLRRIDPPESLPLGAYPLDVVVLSDIVVLEGSWQEVLQGTEFEGVPLQALTLSDVAHLPAVQGLQLGDLNIDSTPIHAFPVAALLLQTVPIKAFPIRAFDGEQPIDEWCELFPDFCAALGGAGSIGDDVTLSTLALAGEDLDALNLAAAPIKAFFTTAFATPEQLEAFPIKAFPIKAFEWVSSPIKAFPIKAFPIKAFDTAENGGIIDCSTPATFDCDDPDATLADAAAAGAFYDEATLEQLIQLVVDFADPAKPGFDAEFSAALDDYSVADFLAGLIPPETLPWEQLDLTVAGLQNAARPPVEPFDYVIDIELSRRADLTVELVVPAGFAYVPGGTTLDGEPADDPSVSTVTVGACPLGDGQTLLTYQLDGLRGGAYQLAVPVRAGLVLGEAVATACVTAASFGDSASASGTALVSVTEVAPGADATVIRDDDVNLGYVTGDADVDIYSFDVIGTGVIADILMSNVPADYDLVLYKPRTAPLRGEPVESIGYLDDVVLDLNPSDDQIQADPVQDVPQSLPPAVDPSGAYVATAISANRDDADERIQTGTLVPGTYYIQVSAYNGALSNDPYALRLRSTESFTRPCSVQATYPSEITPLPAPVPGDLPENLNTLFLVNSQLLRSTYPNDADEVLQSAQAVADADQFGVVGAIVPVDADTAVQGAYEARFADPCNPFRANDVVREIGRVIDAYTTERPGIDYIVIVGDDRQIPMANIVDDANFANERTFAQNFTGNDESIAALLAGMYRTDDPYGTDAGIRVRDHELFVAERAVGRLVETPAQIISALDDFITYEGRLDPDTAANALQTGYEFLSDGAASNGDNLAAGGYDVDTDLINDTWTDQDLAAALGRRQNDVIGIHAHFDENNALPAFGNFNPASTTPDDLFSSDEVPASVSRAVLYSMGCHSGYSRSDVQVGGPAPDWAQQAGGALGNVFVGNTGFGYGDSDKVALAEVQTSYFASEVAEGGPIGGAWVDAKQRMLSDLLVLDAYQEKTMQQFVLYGLPMFHIGEPPPAVVPGAVTAEPGTAAATPVLVEDPITGLQSTTVNTELELGDFERFDTPDGSYFAVDGTTLDAAAHPVEPLFTEEITIPDATGGLLVRARDALITGLSSIDLDPGSFDPLYFRPTNDFGIARGEYFDGSFPAELATVRTSVADGSTKQDLVLGVGQFRWSQENPGIGTQRLHTRLETVVYYSDSTDLEPPAIRRSEGFVADGVAFFEVTTDERAQRVYVLFRGEGTADWTGLDLTLGVDGVWRGGRPFAGEQVEFIVQAVSDAGHVSMSNRKSLSFLSTVPGEDQGSGAPLSLDVVAPDAPSPSGWYTGPVTVEAVGGEGNVSLSVNGAAVAGTTVEVTGPGALVVQAVDQAGAVQVLYVAVDQQQPTLQVAQQPPGEDGSVVVTANAADGAGSGIASVVATAAGAEVARVDAGGAPSALLQFPWSEPGTTTFDLSATDIAGNVVTSSISVTVVPPVQYRICRIDDEDSSVWAGFPYLFVVKVCDEDGSVIFDDDIEITAVSIDGSIEPPPNLLHYPTRRFQRLWFGLYTYKLLTGGIPDVNGDGSHTLEVEIDDADGNVSTASLPFRLHH